MPTATVTTIFLDDGGVMNDNTLRGPEWQRLVGEYLSPRLGGSLQAWAEANRVVIEREIKIYSEHDWTTSELDYLRFREGLDRDWIVGMGEIVGVDVPEGDECLTLARETSYFVTRRVRSAYLGAVDAIRQLHAAGYPLYTASAEDSYTLEGYLEGMGVRDLFRTLYGPDLVNTAKQVQEYHSRVFEGAGVAPGEAVVVDDSPLAVASAREAGAMGVLVSADGEGAGPVIPNLAALPDFLASL
jgi:phosphoglycolate phosphatase-like HAD superfamily hydrolase